ncbi:Cruciform DNA-recognizing protein 1 [Nakaseomyces glabratus]|nr:Cruciform DNA-recognizing protein 1 [Nakaseomyces glabratus]KTB21519.1 Cruciform DNA-recognizing protein 1 [Nakaseomyces glabratus]
MQEIVSFTFRWPAGPQEVLVTGSFDKWQSKIPLVKEADGSYAVTIPLKFEDEGERLYFKFIVDDEWVVSKDYRKEFDSNGFENNFVSINEAKKSLKDQTKGMGSRIPESGGLMALSAMSAGSGSAMKNDMEIGEQKFTTQPVDTPEADTNVFKNSGYSFGGPGPAIPGNMAAFEMKKADDSMDMSHGTETAMSESMGEPSMNMSDNMDTTKDMSDDMGMSARDVHVNVPGQFNTMPIETDPASTNAFANEQTAIMAGPGPAIPSKDKMGAFTKFRNSKGEFVEKEELDKENASAEKSMGMETQTTKDMMNEKQESMDMQSKKMEHEEKKMKEAEEKQVKMAEEQKMKADEEKRMKEAEDEKRNMAMEEQKMKSNAEQKRQEEMAIDMEKQKRQEEDAATETEMKMKQSQKAEAAAAAAAAATTGMASGAMMSNSTTAKKSATPMEKNVSGMSMDDKTPKMGMPRETPSMSMDPKSSGMTMEKETPSMSMDPKSSGMTMEKETPSMSMDPKSSGMTMEKETPAMSMDPKSSGMTMEKETPAMSMDPKSSGMTMEKETPSMSMDPKSSGMTMGTSAAAMTMDHKQPHGMSESSTTHKHTKKDDTMMGKMKETDEKMMEKKEATKENVENKIMETDQKLQNRFDRVKAEVQGNAMHIKDEVREMLHPTTSKPESKHNTKEHTPMAVEYSGTGHQMDKTNMDMNDPDVYKHHPSHTSHNAAHKVPSADMNDPRVYSIPNSAQHSDENLPQGFKNDPPVTPTKKKMAASSSMNDTPKMKSPMTTSKTGAKTTPKTTSKTTSKPTTTSMNSTPMKKEKKGFFSKLKKVFKV